MEGRGSGWERFALADWAGARDAFAAALENDPGPETEWPPPRMVNGTPASLAARIEEATSSASVGNTTAHGLRSIAPFQPARAVS